MANPTQLAAPYRIRGIPLHGFASINQFLDFLLPEGEVKCGVLIAINAEKVLTAEQDNQLRELLLEAEFNYPDGISVVRSLRKKYPQQRINRIAGVDLWQALMQRAGALQHPVFLLGGKPEVLSETASKLQQQWQVVLCGCQDGYFANDEVDAVIARIAHSGAKIVTVAMGSPRQELFIRRCRQRCPDILFMGVGGTYDVFTGRVKRAPLIWQQMGLEWFYRLICQPWRLKRQIKLLRYQRYHWQGDL